MKNKTKQAARIKEHSQTLLRPSLIAEFYYPSVSSEKNKTNKQKTTYVLRQHSSLEAILTFLSKYLKISKPEILIRKKHNQVT